MGYNGTMMLLCNSKSAPARRLRIALRAGLAATWLAGLALAQGEAEQSVPAIEAGPWWIRWLTLLGICAVVSAICFKNPKRGHDQ